MANKVISIKMDEKDIERLKKYYEALVAGGFVTPETLTRNGLYKHLLLDYLEEDVNQAFSIYSEFGMAPRCINPKKLGEENGLSLSNTYGFSEKSFGDYMQCVKETLEQDVDKMRKTASLFNEVLDSTVFLDEGNFCEMEIIPYCETKEEGEFPFWGGKVFQIMDMMEKACAEDSVNADIEMIKKSSLPEELKQKIIDEIEEYERARKQNYGLIHGGKFL